MDSEKCAPWVYICYSVMSHLCIIEKLAALGSFMNSAGIGQHLLCSTCSVPAVQTMQHDNLVQANLCIQVAIHFHTAASTTGSACKQVMTRSSCSHSATLQQAKCRQQGLCRSRRYKAGVMMPCMGDMHTVTPVSRRIPGRFTICLALSAQHDHSCQQIKKKPQPGSNNDHIKPCTQPKWP